MSPAQAAIRTSICRLDQQLALVTERTTKLFDEMMKLNRLRNRFKMTRLLSPPMSAHRN